jgi:hypothetical protein
MKPFMKFAVTALAALSASAAAAGDPRTFELRNESGGSLLCSIKADGSSRSENMMLKSGASWSKSYSNSKARRVRCEGAYSTWHKIEAGRYRLVKLDAGRISVRPLGK